MMGPSEIAKKIADSPQRLFEWIDQDLALSLANEYFRLVNKAASLELLRDEAALLSLRNMNAGLATAQLDCRKALEALAGAGITTPQEGYGVNSSWAISDLCRAVSGLKVRSKAEALLDESSLKRLVAPDAR